MSVAYGGPPGGYAPPTGRVDFAWLGQAWTLFSARAGVWITATLLFFLIGAVLWLLWAIPSGTLAALQQVYQAVLHQSASRFPAQNPLAEFARNHVFAVLAGGYNAVFFGGFYRMALRQRRGEPISALGLFSAFPQALPLLMVGVVAPAVMGLVGGLCVWLLHLFLPPTAAVSIVNLVVWLPDIVLGGLLMFAPLLVVDAGADAADALLGSVRLLKGQWLMGILFYFVAALIGGLGALACGFGMLATYPVFLIGIAVGYLALTQPPAVYAPPVPYSAPGVWPPPPSQAPPPGQPPSFGQSAPPPADPPRRTLGGDPIDDDGNTPLPGGTPPR